MKTFKILATIYDSPEELELNRIKCDALDIAYCTEYRIIVAETIGDAYEIFLKEYEGLYKKLDNTNVYPFYLDEQGKPCR